MKMEEVSWNEFHRIVQVLSQVRHEAATPIPESIDYSSITGLSMEAMEKLERHKPLSLAAASRYGRGGITIYYFPFRIQGVTPDAILLLLRHVKCHLGI